MHFLDFEAPIAEVESQIEAINRAGVSHENEAELNKLLEKKAKLMNSIYTKLSDWQTIQLARHPERPYFLDLVNKLFSDFQELHGDRAFGDDKAVIGGLAKLTDGQSVMVIGQEKGRKTKDKIRHNFGMMHPEGYRKALRLMKLAEKFNIPVITFIDTPGAYPGVKAEERGQSEAIARNLYEMAKLKVPVICVVIGEGCSGGALGIGVGDKLMMLQYSYFATISPEGCASILWKTATKAAEAAEIMGITANRLKELNIVDEVIAEPMGGAHRDINEASRLISQSLVNVLAELNNLTVEQRNEMRYQKMMSFGVVAE